MIASRESTHPRPGGGRRHRLFWSAAFIAVIAILTGDATASAKVPASFFGINAVQPALKDYNGMAGRLNAGSVRIELSWPAIQRKKDGPYDWAKMDTRFRAAVEAGLKPQPVIFGTPTYLTHAPAQYVAPPTDGKKTLARWQQFAHAAAKRYGPAGQFWHANPALNDRFAPQNWILWNEENARAYWYPKVSPSAYAKLLRATRSAFDSVDKSLGITTGGMFGYPSNGRSMDAKPFLRKVYSSKGAKKAIDGVSLHPYGATVGAVRKQVKDAHNVIRKAHDARAKIIIGEIGWASGGKPKNYFLIKDEQGQKRLLQQSFRMLLAKHRQWNIAAAYWFTYKDQGGKDPVCNWCGKAGLLDKHGNLKPAGKAYQAIARKNTR